MKQEEKKRKGNTFRFYYRHLVIVRRHSIPSVELRLSSLHTMYEPMTK
jgi:hypothetical protein